MREPEMDCLRFDPIQRSVKDSLAAVHQALRFKRADRLHAPAEWKWYLPVVHELVSGAALTTNQLTPEAEMVPLAKTTFACAAIFKAVAERTTDPLSAITTTCLYHQFAEMAYCFAPQGSTLQAAISRRFPAP